MDGWIDEVGQYMDEEDEPDTTFLVEESLSC